MSVIETLGLNLEICVANLTQYQPIDTLKECNHKSPVKDEGSNGLPEFGRLYQEPVKLSMDFERV